MSLIVQKTVPKIDLEEIGIGDLVYMKSDGWSDARTGIVIGVTDEKIIVQFKVGEGSATSHSVVTADDLNTGSWVFRWSSDLLTIHSLAEDGETDES